MEAGGDLDSEVAALFSDLVAGAKSAPGDGTARGRLGMAYAANGLREAAARSFEQATALDPGEPRWWFHGAVLASDLGDLPRAIALMDSAIARRDDFVPMWWHRGEWLLALGDLPGAELSFRRATELKPEHPGGWVGLARVALQTGSAVDAAKILEGVLERDPLPTFLPYIHQLLGTAYARTGRLEEAKVSLALGRAGRPPWSDRWSREMDEYRVSLNERIRASTKSLKSGKFDRAIAILEPLRDRHPTDVRVLEQLGVGYFNSGRVPEARAAFEAWLAVDPRDPVAHQHLSRVFQAEGSMKEALAFAEEGVELNPNQARGHRRLAEVLAGLGRRREALDAYRAALRCDPKDPELLLAAGTLAGRLGFAEEANEWLDRTAELYPQTFDARIREARGAIRRGGEQ